MRDVQDDPPSVVRGGAERLKRSSVLISRWLQSSNDQARPLRSRGRVHGVRASCAIHCGRDCRAARDRARASGRPATSESVTPSPRRPASRRSPLAEQRRTAEPLPGPEDLDEASCLPSGADLVQADLAAVDEVDVLGGSCLASKTVAPAGDFNPARAARRSGGEHFAHRRTHFRALRRAIQSPIDLTSRTFESPVTTSIVCPQLRGLRRAYKTWFGRFVGIVQRSSRLC